MGCIGRENGHPGLEGGWRDVVPFTQLLAKNEASKYMATVFTKPGKPSYTQLYSLTGEFFGNVLCFINIFKSVKNEFPFKKTYDTNADIEKY